MKICFSSCGTLSFIERSLWSGVELTLVLHQGRQSTAPFGTVHFLGQWALSTCCLLFWFKLVQGPTNMHFTVHLISAQSSQEGIECNKTKEKLRSYCQISILYLLGSAAMRVRHARLTSLPTSLPGLPKLSLPCRAKRGNPHSNAYPNSCVQIKEAWHCCFGAGRAGPHRQWDNKVRLQPSALQTNGVLPAPLRGTVCPWKNFWIHSELCNPKSVNWCNLKIYRSKDVA